MSTGGAGRRAAGFGARPAGSGSLAGALERRSGSVPRVAARLAAVCALAVWAVLAPAAGGHAQPAAPGVAVRSLDAVGFTVADMDRSVDFFTKVLTFQKLSDVEVHGPAYEHLVGVFGVRMRVVRMKLGGETIELTEYLAPRGRPIAAGARSNDRSFQHIAIIVSDMEKAYARLRQFKVEHASTGPQTLPDYIKAAAGIKAFYFKDPDGHALEVLAFPPDKGAPKWHQKQDALFLGIDHTAIVVSDTDRSLAFYRDLLGFQVAGESENYGSEQEHLNNVFGARLRITGLKPPSGPAVEFLEYLAPRDGRPAPDDLKANDIAHWETTVAIADAETASRRLFAARVLFVSPGAVTMPGTELGLKRGFLVKDPDGHVLRLAER